jgi:chemotaxis signal transduction protein
MSLNKLSEQILPVDKQERAMEIVQERPLFFEDTVDTLHVLGTSIKRISTNKPKVDRQIVFFQVRLQGFAFLAEVVQEIVPMSRVYEDQLFASMQHVLYKGKELILVNARHHIFQDEASEEIPVHGHYLLILRNSLGGYWGFLVDSPYQFQWINDATLAPVTLTHPSMKYIHRVSWFSIKNQEKLNVFLLDCDKLTQLLTK